MSHTITKCKHGRVVCQCRCPGPHKTVLQGPCLPDCPPDALPQSTEPTTNQE